MRAYPWVIPERKRDASGEAGGGARAHRRARPPNSFFKTALAMGAIFFLDGRCVVALPAEEKLGLVEWGEGKEGRLAAHDSDVPGGEINPH